MAQKNLENRPEIETISKGSELKRWYWLKSELLVYAKALNLKTAGGKFDLLNRISHFLDTGESVWLGDDQKKPTSRFDWHKESLTPKTIITDSYKNGQNVRRFFQQHADENFKFNIEFMAWMKANIGKTLGDAVEEYKAMKKRALAPDFESEIAHHNQFNQYTRDFLKDNPDKGMEDVRRFWALKRALPSETGRHVYERSDLNLE